MGAAAVLLVVVAVAVAVMADGPEADDIPASQRDVLRSVRMAQDLVTDNEIRAKELEEERDQEICDVVGADGAVREWVGVVTEVGTTLGNGTLRVDLGDNVELRTADSLIEDITGETTIPPDSPVYDVITQLDKGDKIIFDGTFALRDECAISDRGTLKEPKLLFRFTRVATSG